ncbi:MAG: fibrobacter succinogenes major paralogous domain-containing protein [Crocinitomicaceae bacterium]|nr:fibrobacter succinogenes major paralogous domain-containing protein [Crocinitomicaceae bacterium]
MMKNLLLFCLLFTYVQLLGQKSTDFIDPIDGQVYPTVRICGSTLHTRNLNAAHFRNGDTIAQAQNKAQWMYYQQNNIPAWTYYNADSLHSAAFGKLYNLSAIKDPRGLAPTGWHIPQEYEIKGYDECFESYDRWEYALQTYYKHFYNYEGSILPPRDSIDLNYFIMEFEDTIFEGFYKHQYDLWNYHKTDEILKSKAASRLKSTQYWPSDDIHTNESGFNALPSGFVNADFVFIEKGQAAYFWTSSLDDDVGIAFTLKFRNGEVLTYYNEYRNGYAVRCYEGEPEQNNENDE